MLSYPWIVICERTNWDVVACKIGYVEIDHSEWLPIEKFIQFIEIAGL